MPVPRGTVGLCVRAPFQATLQAHRWSIPLAQSVARGQMLVALLRRFTRHGANRSSGQALVELALVTPVILLLLLAAIDLGRVFYAEISVSNSAREAAMVAANNPTSFSAGTPCNPATNAVMCAATREAQGGGFVNVAPSDVTRTCNPSCAKTYGTHITVTVTGHFQLITPILWPFTGGPNVTFSKVAQADVIVTPAAAGAPTPTPTPAPTPTPSPTPTPDPSASATPTPSPSPTPTPAPTCAAPYVAFTTSQARKQDPVNFTSTATPTTGACAISYWRWDFGDTQFSAGNLPSVSHDYGNQGRGKTYTVTLTVTMPSGTFTYIANVSTLG